MAVDIFTDEFFETLIVHIASGGSLIDVAEMNDVQYGLLSRWVNEDGRRNRYQAAMQDQSNFLKETFLRELKRIATFDIKDILKDDGSIKAVEDWPNGIGAIIKEVKVDELYDGFGKERQRVGDTKTVKFWEKTKALEMLMKNMGLLIPEIQIDVGIADILARANEKDDRNK